VKLVDCIANIQEDEFPWQMLQVKVWLILKKV